MGMDSHDRRPLTLAEATARAARRPLPGQAAKGAAIPAPAAPPIQADGIVAPRRSRLAVSAAIAVLAWERLRPALGSALLLALLFLAVVLSDLLPDVNPWLHLALLVGFLLGIAGLAIAGLMRVRLPGRAEAVRRVERDSGLTHRPYAALVDRPAIGDATLTPGLWARHRAKAAAALAHVRLAGPSNIVTPLWPRAVVACLLTIAVAAGWSDPLDRISRAMRPAVSFLRPAPPAQLDLWITPPAYTGRPPVFAGASLASGDSVDEERPGIGLVARDPGAEETGDRQLLTIPQGSVVTAQVSGGRDLPMLVIDDNPSPFVAAEASAWRIEKALEFGDRLKVAQDGETLGAWRLRILADVAPTIAFVEPVRVTPRQALHLFWKAQDDYGVERVGLRLERVLSGEMASIPTPKDAIVEIALPVPVTGERELSGSNYEDLTAHPWAGLSASATLIAYDAIGQIGRSDSALLTLPERRFTHPVARAIIAERKRLTSDPGEYADVAENLVAIGGRSDLYADDPVVRLGLRLSARRLMGGAPLSSERQPSRGETQRPAEPLATRIPETQALLWDLALRLEDGGVSIAQRELRDVQQALQDALARGANDAEIERLMNEMQAAMERFLQALEEQQRNAAVDPDAQRFLPQGGRVLDRGDLQRMLEQMREASRSGARDAARNMLDRLNDVLENLRTARPTAEELRRSQEAARAVGELERLLQEQQDLLGRTFREAQRQGGGQPENGQPPSMSAPRFPWPAPPQSGAGEGNGQSDGGQQSERPQSGQQGAQGESPGADRKGRGGAPSATEQEEIRKRLGALLERFGEMGAEIPPPFARADQAMRRAEGALSGGEPGAAVPSQTEAVDQLQQGLQSMMDQVQQMMSAGQEGEGESEGQGSARGGQSSDPLGRNHRNGTGNHDFSDVTIPKEGEMQRSREILDELRRRASERARPTFELDYLRRLLDRF